MVDAGLESGNQFRKRCAEGVVHGLAEDIRPRRYKVRSDPECRARVGMMLQPDVSLVDVEILAKRLNALFYEFGECCGWLMVAVCKNEFHNNPRFSPISGFDKYTIWKLL